MIIQNVSYYSVLSASTGSFLDAPLAGIKPAKTVNPIEITISTIALGNDKVEMFLTSVKL